MKYRLPLNLQLFSEDAGAVDTGVESVSAAEGQVSEGTDQTGVESQAAAEPSQDHIEKAFAKRLAAKEAEIEAKFAEKYKDYDVLKEVSDYFVQANRERGVNDVLTLKEQIELERLQARAEQANVPIEVLKRIDELEAKAAKAEEYEQQQAEMQERTEFENGLKAFCEGKELDGKPIDHKELWVYMYENEISKPEVAFKAMKADVLERQLESAKKDGVKEFLAAKGSIPKVEGANKAGQVIPGTPKTFTEARERALQRF